MSRSKPAAAPARSPVRKFLHSRLWRLFLFAALTALALYVEHSGNRWQGLEESQISLMARLTLPLLHSRFFLEKPQYTALLTVEADYMQRGPGSIRLALTSILPKLNQLHPKAIVVDVNLQNLRPTELDPPDEITAKLLRTVEQICRETPVVFGIEYEWEGDRIRPYQSIVPTSVTSQCMEGVTNARSKVDFRLIPLSMGSEPYLSLSFAAAQTVSPNLVEIPVVREHLNSREPLYATLLTEPDYEPFTLSAHQLMSNTIPARLNDLDKRIAVLGFMSEKKVPTLGGDLPGYLLHATYIENLLQRKFLQELPWLMEWIAGIAFWLFVDWHEEPCLQVARGLLGLCAVFVFEIVSIFVFDRYSDFALISTTGVLIWIVKFIEEQSSRLQEWHV